MLFLDGTEKDDVVGDSCNIGDVPVNVIQPSLENVLGHNYAKRKVFEPVSTKWRIEGTQQAGLMVKLYVPVAFCRVHNGEKFFFREVGGGFRQYSCCSNALA